MIFFYLWKCIFRFLQLEELFITNFKSTYLGNNRLALMTCEVRHGTNLFEDADGSGKYLGPLELPAEPHVDRVESIVGGQGVIRVY